MLDKLAISVKTTGLHVLLLCLAALLVAMPVFASDEQPAGAAKPLLAFAARVVGDDSRTRIAVDFENRPDFSVHYVAGPPRIVVDLPATAFGFPATDIAALGLFSDIRYGSMDESSARIVLTAGEPVRLTRAETLPNDDGSWRLVLEAEIATPAAFADLVRNQDWGLPERDNSALADFVEKDGVFTVAVDAGHGGIDAGAIGAVTRTPEKAITLIFAKLLAEKLNAIDGVKAVLTRSDDSFLSLSRRITLARQARADLFISLHADTLAQKEVRGATIYTLSERASDSMAANLAARENLSDQLAGFALAESPPEVADILLDLTRRETQAFSVALADHVVGAFKGHIGLINKPHRFAGFQVLRAPDIPSVLLEMGFLSNAEDERLLLDDGWRELVVTRIVEAVRQYRDANLAEGG